MISEKKYLLLIVLILSLVYGVIYAETPKKVSQRELDFKLSDEAKPWTGKREGMGVINPTHVAILTVQEDDRDHYPINIGFMNELEDKKLLSQTQFAFIVQGRYFRSSIESGGLFRTIRLYAVSQDDARIMTRAYLDYLDSLARRNKENAEKKLEIYRKNAAEAKQMIADNKVKYEQAVAQKKKDISECKAELEKKSARLEEAKKQYYYWDVSDAQKSLQEYNTMINLLEIDIAGFKAKVDVLRKSRSPETTQKGPSSLDETIRRMLVEQEVELAGATVRQQAAKKARAEAAQYCRIFEEYNNVKHKLERIRRRTITKKEPKFDLDLTTTDGSTYYVSPEKALEICAEKIKEQEMLLTDFPSSCSPVKVHENKVTIYPVDLTLKP